MYQDALAHLLANINHTFSVLAITKTWVKESNVNDLSFEGYNFVNNHRDNKIGGGVGLFIDRNIHIKSCQNLMSLFAEICVPRQKHIIIAVICRPPSKKKSGICRESE